MPRKKIDFDTVRNLGLALPGVEEGTAYGARALKVHGKLMACEPVHRSAEPDSLAIVIDREDRAHMLEEAPDVYYITDHYAPYDSVLVRLSQVNVDILGDLLGVAHKFVTSKSKPARKKARRKKRK